MIFQHAFYLNFMDKRSYVYDYKIRFIIFFYLNHNRICFLNHRFNIFSMQSNDNEMKK